MAENGLDGQIAGLNISSATQRCHQLLTQCLDVRLLMDSEWAENRLADFNLWASGIGAAATETDKISLGARLRGRPTLLTIFIRLLQMLIGFLEECLALGVHESADELEQHLRWLTRSRHDMVTEHEQRSRTLRTRPGPNRRPSRSPSPWSDQSSLDSTLDDLGNHDNGRLAETMMSVDSTLDQLNNLSLAVRRAGSQLRLQKADSRFNRSDHSSLETFLKFWVLTCTSTKPIPLDSSADDRHHLSPIQLRLIEANLIRRNRFLYAQRHSKRMLRNKQTTVQSAQLPAEPDDTLPLDKSAQPGLLPPRHDLPAVGQQPGVSLKPAADNSTATRLETATEILRDTTGRDSQITSTALRVRYPNPPKIRSAARFFKCPCCCQTLDRGFSLGNRWRRHLTEDICPYTCIYNDCPTPNATFVTRQAWMKHMEGEEHSTDKFWTCLICADDAQHEDKLSLSNHIREKHEEHISVDQIPTLLDACLRTFPTTDLSCPLCSKDEAEGSRASLDHIAEHIHSFALLSLPWAPDAPSVNPGVVEESSNRVSLWLQLNTRLPPDTPGAPTVQNSTIDEASLYFENEEYFAENESMQSSSNSASTDTDRDLEGFDVEGPLVFSEVDLNTERDLTSESQVPAKLWVIGLNWETSDEVLYEGFRQFGKVEKAVVIRDRETKRSRGYGVVRFSTKAEANEAIKRMNNTRFDGCILQVQHAPQSNRQGDSDRGDGILADERMSNIPQPTTNQGQPDANTNQLMANVMPGNYQQKQTQLFEFTPEENLAIDLRAAELAKSTPEEMRNIVEKMNPELQQSLAEEGLGPIMDYFRMLATKEFRRRRQMEADMDGNAGEMGQSLHQHQTSGRKSPPSLSTRPDDSSSLLLTSPSSSQHGLSASHTAPSVITKPNKKYKSSGSKGKGIASPSDPPSLSAAPVALQQSQATPSPQPQTQAPPPKDSLSSLEEAIRAYKRIREQQMREQEIREEARQEAIRAYEEQLREQRIREEARQEAIRAYEEQVIRDSQIRKEVAETRLRAAREQLVRTEAAEAAVEADKAAAEKKIVDEAAATTETIANEEAAEAVAVAKDMAERTQALIEAKLKEAEEATTKGKSEVEEAEKELAATTATIPKKKAPIRFKDAIGRYYKVSWEHYHRWRDMEGLINQAFAHIDDLGEHVIRGRYDLIGPDKEIIMPHDWESKIEPDMQITMMLWPIPEPPKEGEPQVAPEVDPDAILKLDDIPHPPGGSKSKGKKKKASSAFANWMIGGSPKASRSSKR